MSSKNESSELTDIWKKRRNIENFMTSHSRITPQQCYLGKDPCPSTLTSPRPLQATTKSLHPYKPLRNSITSTQTARRTKLRERNMSTLSTLTASGLLGPVLALNGWTFIIEGWMYATRIPAFQKYNVGFDNKETIEQVNAKIPSPVRWKADNYNHLTEQPTQFYAVALALAIIHGTRGTSERTDSILAWSYVGARVVHSLVQCTSNRIMRRFGVFLVSSGILATMTARAAGMLWRK